ncbi:hypothetical protein CPTB_00499 [Corynebacterium pseudotuberculosis]|nr:hypothetical protein CPTA_01034 [Corynebacterium pseudotuberculosis]AIG08555.1 hypothetical protein CPTB_00499 [Corynebacterium pseudotuberculosis]AIG10447.1 hypothetical protein CPTC_00159 [Corynebacterium pseudotuberculosis]ATQ64820.1 Hypothetical protein CpPA07_0503 [Corynebacterium pseudotuberculosis]
MAGAASAVVVDVSDIENTFWPWGEQDKNLVRLDMRRLAAPSP